MESRVVEMALHDKDRPLYEEGNFNVRVVDEGNGEFIEITQNTDDPRPCLKVDKSEWADLKGLIDEIFNRHVRENAS